MENNKPQSCDSIGFSTLICQEDDEELKTCHQPKQNKPQGSLFRGTLGRSSRLAAVILVLLAAVLLIVDISLGVHYNKLTNTHLTLEDIERIGKELAELKQTYKTAVKATTGAHGQLSSEIQYQEETKWELEHLTKISQEAKVQTDKFTKEIEMLKSDLPMITAGCKSCPSGWLLMNSMCYYFPLSDRMGRKTWQKAREFCQIYQGDLAVIKSQDIEKEIVKYLLSYQTSSTIDTAFWLGLKDSQEEGTWRWLDGTPLVVAYWKDGEPNDYDDEDCAAVYGTSNFFKAWNDLPCKNERKWICEKAPTPES